MDNNQSYNHDNSVPQGAIEPTVIDAPEKDPGKGLAIASLVCGIASLPMMCCCADFGIPVGIAAVILGILSRNKKKENNTMAIIGIILGSVGIVLCIIRLIIGLFTGAALGIMPLLTEGLDSSYYYY